MGNAPGRHVGAKTRAVHIPTAACGVPRVVCAVPVLLLELGCQSNVFVVS